MCCGIASVPTELLPVSMQVLPKCLLISQLKTMHANSKTEHCVDVEEDIPRLIDRATMVKKGGLAAKRGRATAMTVINSVLAAKGNLRCELIRILKAQDGALMEDYRLAAMLLWWQSAHNVFQKEMSMALCMLNANEWTESMIKNITATCRARATMQNNDANGTSDVTYTGRLVALLGRDMRPHDRHGEVEERTSYVNRRNGLCKGYVEWKETLVDTMEYTIKQVQVEQEEQTMEELWDMRALWLPAGASSEPLEEQDKKQMKGTLKTKIVTHKNKQRGWLRERRNKWPRMDARGMTKNEVGLKRRPLRAVDDYAFIEQAHATGNLEKTFKQLGAVMRQRPEDVREVGRRMVYKRHNSGQTVQEGSVYCLDYDAFNTNHLVTDRVELSMMLMEHYMSRGQKDKAKSAARVALAHMNHYVDGVKVRSGLSSGERDTARDNTMMHAMYAMTVLKCMIRA